MQEFDSCPVSLQSLIAKTESLTHSGTWCYDAGSDQLFWSTGTYRIFGVTPGSRIGLDAAIEFYCEPYRADISASVANAIEHGGSWDHTAQIRLPDGQLRWIRTSGSCTTDRSGEPLLYGAVQDISEQMRALAELEKKTLSLNTILDNLLCGVVTIDDRGIMQDFSKTAEKMFGYSASEVVGKNVSILMPNPYAREHDQYLNNYKATNHAKIIGIGRDVEAQRKDGSIFPINLAVSETHTPDGRRFIGMIRDITKQRETAERIRFLSYHDKLTGLPNRVNLLDTVDKWLAHDQVTLIALNLDYFRRINAYYGDEVGDQVLIHIARRIQGALPEAAVLAKDVGDRFWIAARTSIHGRQRTLEQLTDLLEEIRKPLIIEPTDAIYLTASIGVAFIEQNTTSNDAIAGAESALAQAKKNGRDQLSVYRVKMVSSLIEEYDIETGLRKEVEQVKAGERPNFECWLQSKVDDNYQIAGAEALIRWNLNDTLIRPDKFIGVAEKIGLIVDMGSWMTREVAKIIAKTRLPIALNVSPKQFLEPGFYQSTLQIFEEEQADLRLLYIEITENLLLKNEVQVQNVMEKLSRHGVQFSIDDFGTGYSNLGRVQTLPVTEIKIDRQFVSKIFDSEKDRNLLDSIIGMGKALQLSLVAEGVETLLQADYLRYRGCDLQQGFYFYKPIPADHWLENLGIPAVKSSKKKPR